MCKYVHSIHYVHVCTQYTLCTCMYTVYIMCMYVHRIHYVHVCTQYTLCACMYTVYIMYMYVHSIHYVQWCNRNLAPTQLSCHHFTCPSVCLSACLSVCLFQYGNLEFFLLQNILFGLLFQLCENILQLLNTLLSGSDLFLQ